MMPDASVKRPVGNAEDRQPLDHDGRADLAGGPNRVSARFRLRNNQIHEFSCESARSNVPSILTIGVVKGGSSLLHKIVTDLAPHGRRTLLPIDRHFFSYGISIDDAVEDMDGLFGRQGFIFGTFRWLPRSVFIPNVLDAKKVLLVRDPRDMLVSAYYSFLESHGIPESGPAREDLKRARAKLSELSLDDYVKTRADGLKRNYFRTMTLLTTPNTLLRRYEDIIFDKQTFVADLSKFLETDVSNAQIAAIAKKHDVMPDREDTSQHIRQVTPGNFLNKLAPSTVEEITYKLRAILCEFGYS
jgi:hypothetical protein